MVLQGWSPKGCHEETPEGDSARRSRKGVPPAVPQTGITQGGHASWVPQRVSKKGSTKVGPPRRSKRGPERGGPTAVETRGWSPGFSPLDGPLWCPPSVSQGVPRRGVPKRGSTNGVQTCSHQRGTTRGLPNGVEEVPLRRVHEGGPGRFTMTSPRGVHH